MDGGPVPDGCDGGSGFRLGCGQAWGLKAMPNLLELRMLRVFCPSVASEMVRGADGLGGFVSERSWDRGGSGRLGRREGWRFVLSFRVDPGSSGC